MIITQNNPFRHLNYSSDETYLVSHNIDINIVIRDSITHILPNIESNELEDLIDYFMPLVKTKKLKVAHVNTINEKAYYSEIIGYLEYVQKIKKILSKKKYPSDKLGTGFRTSSLKKIVDTKVNDLQNRLNDPHIPSSSDLSTLFHTQNPIG